MGGVESADERTRRLRSVVGALQQHEVSCCGVHLPLIDTCNLWVHHTWLIVTVNFISFHLTCKVTPTTI